MGIFWSKESVLDVNLFEKDLESVNKIVNNLINSNNIYNNHEYNFFLKKKCNEFTIVNEKRLNKYTKYQLNHLDQTFYLIPKQEIANTKKDYCNKISLYFTRILQLIFCIKYIYDLENNGDKSIGGIIMRNIKTTDDLIKVSVCESEQSDIRDFQKGVNFSMLSGFDMFLKFILTDHESSLFLKQLEIMLNTNDKNKLAKYVCKDMIVDKKTHSRIHKANFKCSHTGGKPMYVSNNDLFIKVGKNNPIFNWNLCAFKRTIIAKNIRQLNNILKEMKANYKTNFKKILEILDMLVYYDKSTESYKLLNVSNEALDIIEQKLKRTIVIFFIQSLSDYKNMLNTIKLYSIHDE
jgi:hypothetical protein